MPAETLLHELSHKREIKRSLQMPIEVIWRHQVFQGPVDKRGKAPLLAPHQSQSLSSCLVRVQVELSLSIPAIASH